MDIKYLGPNWLVDDVFFAVIVSIKYVLQETRQIVEENILARIGSSMTYSLPS